MHLHRINVHPLVPLHVVERFLQEVIGWDKGSFDVIRIQYFTKEDLRTFVDYPTNLTEKEVGVTLHVHDDYLELLNNYYTKPNFDLIFAKPHPNASPDVMVNGGALNLALNVLRRADKHEVANELEITATKI